MAALHAPERTDTRLAEHVAYLRDRAPEVDHYGIVPFRHLLEARSIDIVMIDLLRVGGMTRWMKLAGRGSDWECHSGRQLLGRHLALRAWVNARRHGTSLLHHQALLHYRPVHLVRLPGGVEDRVEFGDEAPIAGALGFVR